MYHPAGLANGLSATVSFLVRISYLWPGPLPYLSTCFLLDEVYTSLGRTTICISPHPMNSMASA
jgi:hypothetical protein